MVTVECQRFPGEHGSRRVRQFDYDADGTAAHAFFLERGARMLENPASMKSTSTLTRRFACLAIAVCGPQVCAAGSSTPLLYADPTHESPVRGDPDDLLLLAGANLSADDAVVYVETADTSKPVLPPPSVPTDATAERGVATVVSVASVPDSLTVRLPAAMKPGQSYALWVHNGENGWSNSVRINDARPLWITPAQVYSTDAVASLPRHLKVVGRNLQAESGGITRVRLSGPTRIVLDAADDGDAATTVERFVAKVTLPERLQPAQYTVEVSRDGRSWEAVPGQSLLVRPDPPAAREFPVSAYGCRADDAEDDIPCVISAVRAAQEAGGGAVIVGPGTWWVGDSTSAGVTVRDGIVLPVGVSLRGAGATRTTITTGADWSPAAHTAVFTLQGNNRVEGITFGDARVHRPEAPSSAPILQLGKAYYRVDPHGDDEPHSVEDVTITHNIFARTRIAIGDGGMPVARLYVTYNEFGAYETGLAPAGDRFNLATPFRIDDSIVAYNVFKPGAYLNVSIGQGTIASMLGASFRVDFSDNIADGAATEYLGEDDARGWRAAFFWHLNGNHEMLLVSQNSATCTGDKAGDGEAFSYDNNGGTFAFPRAQTVLDATATAVTVPNALAARQFGRDVAVASYYVGHWLQVGQGAGVGQSRKIQSYRIDGQRVTFTVEPAWDVPPEAGKSRVTIGRQFWQVYTVDNHVDHRKPTCLKSNRTRPKGGVIALWAQTADSVVSGNRQYDSDGILLNQQYSAEDAACPACTAWTMQQSFVEVRDNVIDGEYDWKSDCSFSGIGAWNAASPTPGSPPVVASYGVSIAHNTIRRADGLRGGAITVPLAWHQGPEPHEWVVVSNLLIHHNELTDLAGPTPSRGCDNDQPARMGINVDQGELVWRTVLYANRCTNITRPIQDSGRQTVKVCDPGLTNACECAK